jgi:hypothetical protein
MVYPQSEWAFTDMIFEKIDLLTNTSLYRVVIILILEWFLYSLLYSEYGILFLWNWWSCLNFDFQSSNPVEPSSWLACSISSKHKSSLEISLYSDSSKELWFCVHDSWVSGAMSKSSSTDYNKNLSFP